MEGMINFEAEIKDYSRVRSRIVWTESSSPWIEGGLEDLMVHFAYAGWTAYQTGSALSLHLTSHDEDLGATISRMLSRTMEAMGGVEMGEIRMNQEAMESIRRDHIDP